VAELLGKSEAAVRKRLLRALERLRKIMQADVVG
jgi:DNA-directed RNA polymerase specialized sigma24 family protein